MLQDTNDLLHIVKRTIQSAFPEAEISVVDNPRDHAGGVLYVKNVPPGFDDEFDKSLDFVTVPIGSGAEREVMVIPMPEYVEKKSVTPESNGYSY